MDSFRWVLLLFGAVILLGVFAYSRGWLSWKLPEFRLPRRSKAEPELLPDADEAAAAETRPVEPQVKSPKLLPNSLVVTVRILPRINERFGAEKLILALRGAGLTHGKYGIFHCMSDEDVPRIRYSVASLVEPGSFDLTKLKDSYYDGVSIFMVLPAPENGVSLFDSMLETARRVVKDVDGRLVDERGGALSVQRERYMREEVIEFLRRNQHFADADE